ncbi:16S rRNA (guanine(966)-N(2))-methyltransferase RsmD [Agaribacter flavus]|uniref:Ribosomal RNA small subunit methyltransferase D n=1 Tax=Agaribacter flavus TaxID=1902781 RepID=A0ABV7FSE8_9ALTE
MPSNSKRNKLSRGIKHAPNHKPQLGFVRIISGKHRGRKLTVRDAQGLRPTTDRIKETLFNWLIGDVAGKRVLDMFAGSGSLGFEALSRHADNVTFFELDPKTTDLLRENAKQLKENEYVHILQGDALQLANKLTRPVDLVFIDPPFNMGLLDKSVEALLASKNLNPAAKLYLEFESDLSFNPPKELKIIKEKASKTLRALLLEYQASDI